MPSTNGFGISYLSDESIESIEISFDSETKMLMNANGDFAQAHLYDTTGTFSVKGWGTPSVAVGSNSGAPSFVVGKIIVTSVKTSQTNEDFERYEYSGTAYLNAS
jgi:hypothetical protein